jgi:undecaprenyl-diphosphatase
MSAASTHVSLWQSLILGVVEGVTEFLPVSSTGHLTIAEDLMNLKTNDDAITAYTAVIQDGAIIAAIVFFWRDVVRVVKGWLRGLVNADARRSFDYRFGWYVIWATVPIGILGLVAKPLIEGPFRVLWTVALALIIWSAALIYAERVATQERAEDEITLRDALVIGAFQCLALIPGVSRSGATISGGLYRGLDRVSATRFSFLLGIPALIAAGLFELPNATSSGASGASLIAGVVVSFTVAYIAIAWLLRFVAHHSIERFVPYRVLLGIVVIILLVAGVVDAT